MQIHELNDFAGTLGSQAFLAVDNGTDTGKVSTAALLSDVNDELDTVNDRIDNIVSGVTVDTEVIDARTGADGTVYPSLRAAIVGQVTDLDDEIVSNEKRINHIEDELLVPEINKTAEILTLDDGHYIRGIEGVDATNGTYNSWAAAKMTQMFDVRGVKKIKVSSYAYPNVPVVVFFSDNEFSNDNYISSALFSSSGWLQYDGEVVDVPAGAKYMCINGRSGDSRPITLYLSTLVPANLSFEKDYCEAMLREDNKNPFAWGELDKTCFSVRVDDLLSDVDLAVKIATDNGVPISIACDVSKLGDLVDGITVEADKIGTTRKEVVDYCVEHGGEVLLHPSATIDADNWEKLLIRDKSALSDYTVRGCAVANSVPAAELKETLKPYLHGFYDYSDGYGSEIEYNTSNDFSDCFTIRKIINLTSYPTIADLKTYLDGRVGRNWHYTLIFHSITGVGANGVSTAYFTEAIQYLKTMKTNGLVNLTTWNDVYSDYGSTELEKRIAALEA